MRWLPFGTEGFVLLASRPHAAPQRPGRRRLPRSIVPHQLLDDAFPVPRETSELRRPCGCGVLDFSGRAQPVRLPARRVAGGGERGAAAVWNKKTERGSWPRSCRRQKRHFTCVLNVLTAGSARSHAFCHTHSRLLEAGISPPFLTS